MSSARAVRCRLKCHNERNPCRQLPSSSVGDSDGTATARCEEGGDDVKSARPLRPGRHTCYNGGYRGMLPGDGMRISKSRPSSDRSLQLDSVKLDSLVIAHQPWLGLSRNKVAVPEGVAGTPPFWSRSDNGRRSASVTRCSRHLACFLQSFFYTTACPAATDISSLNSFSPQARSASESRRSNLVVVRRVEAKLRRCIRREKDRRKFFDNTERLQRGKILRLAYFTKSKA